MNELENTPKEKLDKMEEAINRGAGKSKIEGPLKVKAIDIQHIKNIDYINATFSDWVVVGGNNAHGKTSFIDSIFLALKGSVLYGQGTDVANIIQQGENKAKISLILKGEKREITIHRTFRRKGGGNKLEAFFEDGTKIKQEEISELINALTIDPLKLDKMNITKSIAEIKAITGLDTSEIDEKLKKSEEERKNEKLNLIRIETLIEETTEGGAPKKVEKVDINELLKIKEGFDGIDRQKQTLKSKLEEYTKQKESTEELKEKLKKEEDLLEGMYKAGKKFKENIGEDEKNHIDKYGSKEKCEDKLNNSQETNKEADEYDKYIKQIQERMDAEKSVDKCEDDVENLRAEKLKMIKASKMPDYMKISEDYGIMVDDIEYKHLNTARKIEVAIDLVLITKSPLRVLNIEEGGELDLKTLSKIQDKVLAQGFQIFIQRAKIDDFDTIIINEGELIEDESEKQKLKDKAKTEEKEILDKLKK